MNSTSPGDKSCIATSCSKVRSDLAESQLRNDFFNSISICVLLIEIIVLPVPFSRAFHAFLQVYFWLVAERGYRFIYIKGSVVFIKFNSSTKNWWFDPDGDADKLYDSR